MILLSLHVLDYSPTLARSFEFHVVGDATMSGEGVQDATFLTDVLGLPAPVRFGPFLVVELSNGVSLDFHETDSEIASQHFLTATP